MFLKENETVTKLSTMALQAWQAGL